METQLQLVENRRGLDELEALRVTTALMSFMAEERRKRGWDLEQEPRGEKQRGMFHHIVSVCRGEF